MKRKIVLVVIVILLWASLACLSPLETSTPDPELATPEPTSSAPMDNPTATAPMYVPTTAPTTVEPPTPLTFMGNAIKTDYASSGQGCDVAVIAMLTVNPDGTAELSTTGPDIIDHYNCQTGSDETWYINGTADSLNQTVTFATCNFGGFTAKGILSYAGAKNLGGTVSCFYKNGTQAIMLVFSQ